MMNYPILLYNLYKPSLNLWIPETREQTIQREVRAIMAAIEIFIDLSIFDIFSNKYFFKLFKMNIFK